MTSACAAKRKCLTRFSQVGARRTNLDLSVNTDLVYPVRHGAPVNTLWITRFPFPVHRRCRKIIIADPAAKSNDAAQDFRGNC